MATTVYPAVTATSGTANVKGAYTQVVASTAVASSHLSLWLVSGSLNTTVLLDVATGAAGSETVLVSNVFYYTDTDGVAGGVATLDVDVPAGTRIAVRVQATAAATGFTVQVAQDSRALGSLTNPVTYGDVTANSRGTAIDPGGTINTKGAYVPLTASTTARLDALLVSVNFDNTITNAVPTFTQWHVDIATGAAGSEVVVLANLLLAANTSADNARPTMLRMPIVIASGTRLAVRCDCTQNGATTRSLRVALIGMQEPATSGGGTATSVAYLG